MNKHQYPRAALRAKQVALAVTAAFAPLGSAFGLPTGESLQAGDVTVTRPTTQTMQIDQGTQKGIVNWNSFSIGAGEHVSITQPNASAALLNRVVGNSPSEIFGRLTANGQVFLVNNAGVLFAPGASVEAGALLATTLSITDQNFLNGSYQFYNPGNAGSVTNAGSIITGDGGFAALLGPQVHNSGVIIANAGKVALGAGDRISLDMLGDGLISISVDEGAFNASVVNANTGTLQADGGTVMLKASSVNALLDTVINTSGVIRASGLFERNGEIVLDGGNAGAVQVSGRVQAESGSIAISAGGALNVGSTACCFPTTVIGASQDIRAGSITIGGGAQVVGNTGTGTQTVTTPGTLLVRGGVLSGSVGLFHNGTGEQRISAGNIEVRGGTGTGTGAFINSFGGGDQHITVPGTITITGGSAGTANRAGFVANANQTIDGNPDIVLTGGSGGGAGNASNNVFIQGAGDDTKVQRISARNIEIRSGAGADAAATFNAARQVISASGNVSLFGGAGPGGANGVRIGGVGGNVLGPTNLTLSVGGDLLLHGGTVNGAALGSSGPSTQANTISVLAGGDVTLRSDGAGARIGANASANPVNAGNISVTAGDALDVGAGTGIRASGPITLTATSLVNDGTITNGGGASTANVILNANAFDLDGGNIQGGNAAVILRPRDGTRSFGIEAAGDTTLTNADIASIQTSNFVVFGSGMGTTFTGSMTIGENAQVEGGGKHLAFFRSTVPGGATTIGAHGVSSSGDVIVSAGGGAIASNGGTVAGDEVQLRASQGIGAPGARVNTAANALAMNNGFNGVFVSEVDDVTLRTVALNVGGIANVTGTSTGGLLDLDVGGALNVTDAVVSSFGGQSITAQSVNVTAQNGRVAQLLNSGFGNQTITGGSIDVQTLAGGGVAEIRNNSAGQQLVNVTGDHLNVHGLGGGLASIFAGGNQTIAMTGVPGQRLSMGSDAAQGVSSIVAGGDQLITGGADIAMTGGSGPLQDGSNALIVAFNPQRTQHLDARTLSLANSTLGGNNSVAAILGASQLINTQGDVTLTANASGGNLPGVRIGGLGGGGGAASSTNLTLNVGEDLILTGGTLAGNGVGIGSTASPSAPGLANNIQITAGGDVVLNSGVAGSGARIGSSQTGTGPGTIGIAAGGGIYLNGVDEFASIRTSGDVALNAARIGQNLQGRVIAGSLSTSTSGDTSLAGPNQVSNFSASAGGDVTLNNNGVLNVSSLFADNATLSNAGDVTLSGPWNTFGATSIAVASDLTVNSFVQSNGPMTLDVDGTVRVTGSGFQDASLTSFGGQTIDARALEVTSLDGRFASVGNNISGDQLISVSGGGIVVDSVSGNGFAFITNSGAGGQQIAAANGPGIQVRNSSGSGSGQINNFGAGGQTIAVSGAGGVEVRTSPGIGFAMINNSGAGHQSISVAGGTGIDVVAGGGFVQISSAGNQTISVIDGDHFNINGAGGNAIVTAFAGGQTITLDGNGANALNVGSADSVGVSQLVAASQIVNAGSITIVGADAADRTNGFITTGGGALGRMQTIQATGAITVAGGSAPSQFIAPPPRQPILTSSNAGFFHNSTGLQTIQAADIVLLGGASGLNNGAFIASNAGGDQNINVSGGISLTGGAGGDNNSALIVGRGNQAIVGNPHVALTGGSGSGGIGSNSAFIIANTVGKTQTISAADITVAAGSGGINNSAGITGTRQVITTLGDLTMSGGASTGQLSGTRIGGLGGVQAGPTDLTLNVGGNLLMTGGSAEFNGASIGSTLTSPALANSISISAAGDVVLNPGTGAGARIGSSTSSDEMAPGTIAIAAGGNIALNGNSIATPTAIRTLGNVILNAGGAISEGSHGRIEAGSLTTISGGATSLTGPNEIASFSATSTAGGVTLNNTGVLDVTGMNAAGDATITNIGDVTVSGPWTVSGTSTITVGSDIVVNAPMASQDVVLVANDGAILEAASGSITADTLTTVSSGQTSLLGPNDVDLFNSTSSGGLTFNNTSGTLTLGNIETNGAAFTLSQAGDMTVTNLQSLDSVNWDVNGSLRLLGGSAAGSAAQIAADGSINISVGGDLQLAGGSGDGAFARILGYSDINLTIGGFLTLNAGSGQGSWASIQTPSRDQVITLHFPNLSSGGYFVNGVEGEIRDGFSGFLSGMGAAALGHQLVTTYGEQ